MRPGRSRLRFGTSASQLYRLPDPANSRKSVGQLLALLHLLDCNVELVVKDRQGNTIAECVA